MYLNMIIHLWFFLIFVPLGSCSSCGEGFVSTSDIIQDSELSGDQILDMTVFQIPGVGSWMYCIQLCLQRLACKSVVYDYSSGSCTGYVVRESDGFLALTSAVNKSYTDSINLPGSLAGGCSGHNCGFNERCILDISGFRCIVVALCSVEPSHSNAAVLSIDPDKKVEYQCTGEDGGKTFTRWCFAMDKWTPTHIKCNSDS